MNRLNEEHIQFLRQCSANPWKKHESNLDIADLQKMVDEGLLVKYNGQPQAYAITRVGSQVASSFGASLDLIKIAIDFVVSRGYTEEAAKQIVSQYGPESILKSKLEFEKEESTGQQGIKIPLDEQGKPSIKFRG